MIGRGTENPALYRELKDILERQPELSEVRYELDAIQKRYLSADVSPKRVHPPTGPAAPQVEVRWKLVRPHDEFRIDYYDTNLDLHCGWHRDGDHADLGATHFQYKSPETDGPCYEPATITADAPARILWECLRQLFETELERLASE
jgi:hypothetical protein